MARQCFEIFLLCQSLSSTIIIWCEMFAIKLYFGDNPSPTFNDHRVTNQNNGCFWDNIYLFVQMFIWLRPDLVTLLCMTNFVYISVSVQIDAAAEFVNKN